MQYYIYCTFISFVILLPLHSCSQKCISFEIKDICVGFLTSVDQITVHSRHSINNCWTHLYVILTILSAKVLWKPANHNLFEKYCYYPHFIKEEMNSREVSNMSKSNRKSVLELVLHKSLLTAPSCPLLCCLPVSWEGIDFPSRLGPSQGQYLRKLGLQ